MKTTHIIIAGVITIMIAVGCKKTFLDKMPLDAISEGTFFKTEEDARNAVNGAYQRIQTAAMYNRRAWQLDIIAGNAIVGAGGGNDGREINDIANFITQTDNAAVLDMWRGPYPGILRCNLALQKIPTIKMDEALASRFIGELKFMRALYYFWLVRLFGDVPLITEPQTLASDYRVPRTPKVEVYAQIIKDLEDAISALPPRETYTGNDIGRASKGSAVGLLAKVYLTLGEYEKVIPLCEQVKSLGYKLNPSYGMNFSYTEENTTESLFEVQYVGNSGQTSDNEGQSNTLSTWMGPRNSNYVDGGYGWCQPEQQMMDAYEPGDLRKDVTMLYGGGPKLFGNITYDPNFSMTGFNVRKWLIPRDVASKDNDFMNIPILRYADVLLMWAEALNETGGTNLSETPFNEVRSRAGLPPIHGLSQQDMKEKILHERRIEFAYEGQWWFNIIRINNGQYAIDFLKSIGRTNMSEKFLLFPIPQQEMDANPKLIQNPGY